MSYRETPSLERPTTSLATKSTHSIDSSHNDQPSSYHSPHTSQQKNRKPNNSRTTNIQDTTQDPHDETSSLDYSSSNTSTAVTRNPRPSSTIFPLTPPKNRSYTSKQLSTEWASIFNKTGVAKPRAAPIPGK
jgi:hypothetical protein